MKKCLVPSISSGASRRDCAGDVDSGRGDAALVLAFALGTLVGGVLVRACAPPAREKTLADRQPTWRIQYTTSAPR